jgi:hypothetical protein
LYFLCSLFNTFSSDSTVLADSGIEPIGLLRRWHWQTASNHSARSHLDSKSRPEILDIYPLINILLISIEHLVGDLLGRS